MAESGVPGYEANTWFGLFTTAGTPREVVLKINAEVQRLFNERHSASASSSRCFTR